VLTVDVEPVGCATVTLTEPALAIAEAGTTAVRLVALPYVVVSGVEPNITVELAVKPVPVTLRANCAPPFTAEAGLRLAMAGPLVTVNVLFVEDDPPGFATWTFAVPASATSAAVTAAVSDVALTWVVVSDIVPQTTVEPLRKFVPVTVIVKPDDPAMPVAGLSEVSVGPFTWNVLAAEDEVLVFFTVTLTGPAEASCVLVTAAVSEVALT
jgi:hypothetical protein